MSKTSEAAAADTAKTDQPVADVMLAEFCRRLSETVRSPELISAFEFTERSAGNLKCTPEAFQARFDAFVKSPA